MFKINYTDYKDLILGASIYSTGGGIPYDIQINKGNELFSKIEEIKILEKKDFNKKDFICNIYGIGSAGDNNFDLKAQFEKGFEYIKNEFHYNISGIFEAETNIESILFEMSLSLNIPIFDADCTGGRAVPELIYDNFVIENKSFLPLIAIDKNLNIYTIIEKKEVKEIEDFLRNLYIQTGGSIAVIDHIVNIEDAKKLLTIGVLKRDLKLGKEVKNLNINKIVEIISGEIIGEGIVTEINFEDKDGFLQGDYKIKLNSGEILQIIVKNENMFLYDNYGKLIINFPDYIITIYKNNFIGIHNSSLKIGDNIYIIKKLAEKRWKEKYKSCKI